MNSKDIQILHSCSVKEALVRLNDIADTVQTLFVITEEGNVIGSVTNGDIRRWLIVNGDLNEKLGSLCHKDFCYFDKNNFTLSSFLKFKKQRLEIIPYLDEEKKIVKIYKLADFKSLLPIDAVLMAGGKGERLRPLTDKIPKPLLKIGEKAIIDYNVDHLIQYGVSNINVTVNYLCQQVEEHFASTKKGIQVHCIKEPQYLGTIGSIKFIKHFQHDTVLIMNSDLFTNINFEDFYLHFKENNADMSVAAIPYSVSVPYGIFDIEEDKITGIREKPTYNYYANSGIYLIKRKLLDLIPEEQFFNATDLIEKLITEGYQVVRFPLVGYWIDIGKPEDYKRAQDFVKHL